MRYPFLVFDWDGTIVDSIGNIVACTQATLTDLEIDHVSDESIRSTIGLGLRETVESFLPGLSPTEFERLVERYRHHWIATYGHRSQAYEGIGSALAQLEARGHLLAVATGKSRRGLEKDFEITGFRPRFVASKTVDEAASKPHPQMLLDLLEEFGQHAEQTLMIGDTTHDLDMAANADVHSVAVLSGSHDRKHLETRQAQTILDSVRDLETWLGEIDAAS